MGDGLGISTTALLTRMDNPVGRSVGNALEVAEAVQCLHGSGPPDLVQLTCKLGTWCIFCLNLFVPIVKTEADNF